MCLQSIPSYSHAFLLLIHQEIQFWDSQNHTTRFDERCFGMPAGNPCLSPKPEGFLYDVYGLKLWIAREIEVPILADILTNTGDIQTIQYTKSRL